MTIHCHICGETPKVCGPMKSTGTGTWVGLQHLPSLGGGRRAARDRDRVSS